MNYIRQILTARPGSAATFLALGLLLLVIAQLTWWVIFFERNQRESSGVFEELDRLRLAVANADRVAVPSGLEKQGTRYVLAADAVAARTAEHRRKLGMLISETLFVIVVISYGTYRLVRAVRRESRLNHERTIFLDSVTHELKTPLSAILLNLQTMQKRRLDDTARQTLLAESVQDVRRLEEQLNNILLSGRISRDGARDFVRGQTGEAHAVDAVAAIQSYFSAHARYFEKCELTHEITGPAACWLRLAPAAFEKIAGNIIQNAVQYSPARPELRISITTAGRYGVLRFADRGAGIPPAELKNVFSPFYRLTEGRRPVKGSGMGLYLVRELVSAAGGSVYALSNTAAGLPGITIEVRLPLARRRDPGAESA